MGRPWEEGGGVGGEALDRDAERPAGEWARSGTREKASSLAVGVRSGVVYPDAVTRVLDQLAHSVGMEPAALARLLISAGAVVVLLLLRVVVRAALRRRAPDEAAAFHWNRLADYALVAVGLVLLLRIWVRSFGNLGTFLGLLSAGVAVALGDILRDIAGWMFIAVRRPYRVGDRIEMAGHMGDVVDIRLFATFVLECGNWVEADQSTGRIVMIPNSAVFSSPVANATKDFAFIWHEVPVLVTFESDWRRAREVLLEVAREVGSEWVEEARRQVSHASRRHLVVYRHLEPTVYTTTRDSGVLLTVRLLVPVRSRRAMDSAVWERILERFAAEPAVDLAYPTQRVYFNPVEGKPGARAELPEPGRGPTVGTE